MTFTIIGTGNIAWMLASRLVAARHTCVGVYGRTALHAQQLADRLNASVIDSIKDIEDNIDCCIIAVSDNAIETVAATLKFENTVLIHTAGAVNTDVLSPVAQHYGVLWPVYSITKEKLPAHRNIPTIIEASTTKAKNTITHIAECYTDDISFMNSKQRTWMHLTAVISNNFSNHLFAICEKICTEKQIPFDKLYPIINQTIERLANTSPYEQQTGPAKRGDETIISKQTEMLKEHPDYQELYKSVTASIQSMYGK